MGEINAKGDLQELSIEAVVIRADGTKEDLGTVSYWHKSKFKRLEWAIKQRLRRA